MKTTLLPNPDFLNWLTAAIAGARKSIIVVNYLATLDEKDPKGSVTLIVVALVHAAKRGASVTVILEGSKFRENYPFYRRLKDGGCDVWMDTSLTFIHTKAILVDDREFCVGSHNLSASALTRHEEMSIATCDTEAIARFHRELDKMTAQRRQIAASACRDGTKFPVNIISFPSPSRGEGQDGGGSDRIFPPLIRIKRSTSPHAYLLYLLLAKLDCGKPREISIDADAWARELALPASTASADVRIATILDFMDKKLGVVKYDRKNSCVSRQATGSRHQASGVRK